MVGKKQFENVDDGLLVLAPAKINLSLLVGGKRGDGFHEIETVMAKVNFFDEVLIQGGQKDGIEVVCKGPCRAPQGRENLVYRACELLLETCGRQADVKITLTKNVPAGAGLGSASSDAAATLIGVNRFLRLGLWPKKLVGLAAKLGSDVAFFLNGPLAFCTGKGEKIKKLDEIFSFFCLLVLPNVTVSTKEVYANYNTNRALYEKLSAQIKCFLEENRIDLVSKMCANMLETTCFDLYREVAELKNKIESSGFAPFCLSGSGSAMFCITDNRHAAARFQSQLEKEIGCKTILVGNNRW
jgi:4-diphosphocytidyl-2-C-methyl-D-erythritol kinase